MPSGPDIWGPHGWKFIHFIALGYPANPTQDHKNVYKTFFELFSVVIPCSICAKHFGDNLKKHPLDDEALANKESLIHWTIKMHNEVNKVYGKKQYTFEEGLAMILDGSMPYKCSTIERFCGSNYSNVIIIFLIVIIVVLLVQLKK